MEHKEDHSRSEINPTPESIAKALRMKIERELLFDEVNLDADMLDVMDDYCNQCIKSKGKSKLNRK